jgi:uncharacterized membrane protein
MQAHEVTSNTPVQNEVGTGRLETLTDGIFAIAMTILVIGLVLPSPKLKHEELVRDLLNLLPNVVSLVVSFVILGVYWVETHTQFRYIRRADHLLIWLNIFYLLGVTLLPFSAGLLGRFPYEPIAVIIYGCNLLVCLLFHFGMWWHATRGRRLVDADLDDRFVNFGIRLALLPAIGYLLAIAVSFLSTWVSIVIYAVVPIPYILGIFYRRLEVTSRKSAKAETHDE